MPRLKPQAEGRRLVINHFFNGIDPTRDVPGRNCRAL